MEFRTKREAEEAAKDRDERAQREDNAAEEYAEEGCHTEALVTLCRRDAAAFRAEAARIRTLLPTLPERA